MTDKESPGKVGAEMRIDLNNSIAQQIAAERTDKSSNKPGSSTSVSEDKASFSQAAESMSSLMERALAASTSRQERIAALREAVANGQYRLDADAMAEAMLNEGGA